jgi:hypothetical protein
MAKLLESRLPLALTDVDADIFNRLVRILEINLGKFDPTQLHSLMILRLPL